MGKFRHKLEVKICEHFIYGNFKSWLDDIPLPDGKFTDAARCTYMTTQLASTFEDMGEIGGAGCAAIKLIYETHCLNVGYDKTKADIYGTAIHPMK